MFDACFEAWANEGDALDARAGRAIVAETIWHVRNLLTRAPRG